MIQSLATTDRPVPPPEPLEPRRLLSATVVNHVLIVEGTRRPDRIVIYRDGRTGVRVAINKLPQVSVTIKTFSSLRVVCGLGDDSVTIGDYLRTIDIPTVVDAGGGNDYVTTSVAKDTLWGGDGNDTLESGPGDDELHGGAGLDLLRGFDGNDTLYGDTGADELRGGGNDDLMIGGRGDDLLRDGAGDDSMYGNGGHDKFWLDSSVGECKDRDDTETAEADPVMIPQPICACTIGLNGLGTGRLVLATATPVLAQQQSTLAL
jgi:hypothetical protein